MWLKRLIAEFIKKNGRKPNAIETIQLKFRANDMANKGQIIKPDFKNIPGPKNQIMGSKGIKGLELAEDRKARLQAEGKEMMDKLGLKEFTRREDLYEGLPNALRNVKNPEEVKRLLDSGDIKIGTAPKTTKIKDSVDPKFKRAVES